MPHSSVEAGERALPDPGERRGCRVVDQTPDRAEDVEPPSVSLKANGPCEGQHHNVTSRVHLTCTPGSVGDLGGRPPRSTRPNDDCGRPSFLSSSPWRPVGRNLSRPV